MKPKSLPKVDQKSTKIDPRAQEVPFGAPGPHFGGAGPHFWPPRPHFGRPRVHFWPQNANCWTSGGQSSTFLIFCCFRNPPFLACMLTRRAGAVIPLCGLNIQSFPKNDFAAYHPKHTNFADHSCDRRSHTRFLPRRLARSVHEYYII